MTSAPFTVDLAFRSGGQECRGTFFPAVGDGPRPCVVMAHGLGGTADSGLEPFARAFAEAGFAALTFDYHGFGRSGGEPRQIVSAAAQQDDYRAAMRAVGERDDVDEHSIVLWGCSLSGGHVLEVARGRADVAAVIAMVPLVDGVAAARQAMAAHRPSTLARSTGLGVAARIAPLLGRTEPMLPLVGEPGSGALLSLDGYAEAYTALAGPSWRNEVGAGIAGELGSFRPARHAAELLNTPVLFQVGEDDRSGAPEAAYKAGFAAHAEIRRYPADHFDLFPGRDCHERAVRHQLHFLSHHLGKGA